MSDDKFTLNMPRSSSRGQRFGVEVRSEPLTFDLNPERLGSPIAAAIADVIREQIAALPGNLYMKTGTLVRGIAARLSNNATYSIEAPDVRLQRDPKLMERLRQLVPLLREPLKLIAHPKVQAARERVVAAMVTKGRS